MSDEDFSWPEVAKAIVRMACIPDGIILPPGELDEWLDALAGHDKGDDLHVEAVRRAPTDARRAQAGFAVVFGDQ